VAAGSRSDESINNMASAMTGKSFLDAVGRALAGLVGDGMERLFGPAVRNRVVGEVSWVDLGTVVCLVLLVLVAHAVCAWVVRVRIRVAEEKTEGVGWRGQFFRAVGKPLYLLIWVCGGYLAVSPLLAKLPATEGPHLLQQIVDAVFGLGVFAVVLWLFFRLTRVLERLLGDWAKRTQTRLDDLVVPLVGRSLRVIVPVVGIILALPLVGLPPAFAGVLAKGSSILIVGTVAWILFQGVHLGEKAVLAEYDIKAADNLQARKVYTQVHVLSKTLYVIISIFTAASILMLFDEVRRFGASLLASAGVVGIIAGFAAQRTIANLFAGFQLAMTQPIRLDDVVIVEGEWGRVEEITLTYVVIHIWDDRRLVVPLSYFIEKPFQNWTRVSANLLGSVFLWVDYSLPLGETREAVRKIVEGSPLWDKRFWNLVVTDANERAMQIRVLATAADSGKAWDLRCEIREKLVQFIQAHYPESLPRLRGELGQSSGTTRHWSTKSEIRNPKSEANPNTE
jgi:small-conductance mechanosensitive channel